MKNRRVPGMDEPVLPTSALLLATRLVALRNARRERQAVNPRRLRRPRALSAGERRIVFEKTDGRCHICGGQIEGPWEADHVLSRSGGGPPSVDNYLPAHSLCNNYRWDYSSEEFQWIMKIGIWARLVMEKGSGLGDQMLEAFFEYEVRRQKRRRRSGSTATVAAAAPAES